LIDKNERPTKGLSQGWRTNKFLSFCSLSAAVRAQRLLFSFLLLTSTLVFQLGCGSGLDIIKYQHSSKPYPLGVIVERHKTNGQYI